VSSRAPQRADAVRNVEAILNAADDVFRDPHATVADVARAAGVARQTIYAHYGSREALILAVLRRSAEKSAAILSDVEFESDSHFETLLRFVEHGWDSLERHSALLTSPGSPIAGDELHDLHAPISHQLEQLVRRGQRSGTFAKGLAPTWAAAMTIACIRAAADAVRTGHAKPTAARAALRMTLARLYGIAAGWDAVAARRKP
jgi:AcrR family transcriptional regulator